MIINVLLYLCSLCRDRDLKGWCRKRLHTTGVVDSQLQLLSGKNVFRRHKKTCVANFLSFFWSCCWYKQQCWHTYCQKKLCCVHKSNKDEEDWVCTNRGVNVMLNDRNVGESAVYYHAVDRKYKREISPRKSNHILVLCCRWNRSAWGGFCQLSRWRHRKAAGGGWPLRKVRSFIVLRSAAAMNQCNTHKWPWTYTYQHKIDQG